MEIASIYAQNLRSKSDSQYIPEGSSNKGFDEYISQAEAKSSQSQKAERNEKSYGNTADRNRKVNGRQDKNAQVKSKVTDDQELQQPQNENAVAEEKSPSEQANQAGQTQNNQAVEAKPKSDKIEDIPEMEMDTINSQIVMSLANKLDIPVEEVTKLLEKLDIQPLDLMDKEILGSFMRELFGVESNVELLNVPNVNEAFTLVNEALSEATKATNADKPVIAAASANVKQPVELASEKNMDANVNESLAVDGELTSEVSQTVTKSEESKNSNQNTGQGTNSGTDFAQTANAEINVEQVNNENIAITTENANESSRVIRVETRAMGERTINQAEVVKQVIEHVKTDVKGNVSEVKMLLKPESLGELSLKISIENGIITAQFTAENQRVKEIIESNFNQLKEALSQSGVEVGALSVSVSSDNENEAMNAYERERQKSARRISKIIAGINATEGVELEAKLINEEDVIGTQVNYTV